MREPRMPQPYGIFFGIRPGPGLAERPHGIAGPAGRVGARNTCEPVPAPAISLPGPDSGNPDTPMTHINLHHDPVRGALHDMPATGAPATTRPGQLPRHPCAVAPDMLPGPRRAPFTRAGGDTASQSKGRHV